MDQWTCGSVPEFSLKGLDCIARLLDVHDGDTVTVAADLGPFFCKPPLPSPPGCVFRFSIRLEGINAHEVTSSDPEVKNSAQMARCLLASTLAPGIEFVPNMSRTEMRNILLVHAPVQIRVKAGAMDKYGRVLADVWAHGAKQSASEILLQSGLVKTYMH